MTTTSPAPTAVSKDRLESFAEQVFESTQAALELTVLAMGRELGLYAALRGAPSTPSELASRAGVDARYAREWLEHQAVAQVLLVENPEAPADDRRYTLPEEHAIGMLDEDHPAYVGALADFIPVIARRSNPSRRRSGPGEGVPFAAYELHGMQAGFHPTDGSAATGVEPDGTSDAVDPAPRGGASVSKKPLAPDRRAPKT